MPRIVITGTSRGLGRALVGEFADSGWEVVAISRERAVEATEGFVRSIQGDVRERATVDKLKTAIGDAPVPY